MLNIYQILIEYFFIIYMDIIYDKLTHKDYISKYTSFDPNKIIKYVKTHKKEIFDSFYLIQNYDVKHGIINKQCTTTDEFCVFTIKNIVDLLNKLEPLPRYTNTYVASSKNKYLISKPNIIEDPHDEQLIYHPEYLLANINKPAWKKEEVSMEDYWDYWNIYEKKCNGFRYLPLYTAPHRRPIDRTPYPDSIELIQEPRRYFNTYLTNYSFINGGEKLLH